MPNESGPSRKGEENAMSEIDNRHADSCSFAAVILLSLNVFLRNPRIFLSIYALTVLPLSFLLFALSLSSHPIQARILHLEVVALAAPTRFEARHVWEESRAAALSLLFRRALFLLPCSALSLLALVSAAASASAAASGRRASLASAVAAVRHGWKRAGVTSICAYCVVLVSGHVVRSSAAVSPPGAPRLALVVLGSGVEVYLMAVLSLGLVVSVLEERFGWDAIRAASDLMEGRRVCGWALSGLLLLVTGFIGWELDGLMMNGRDALWGSGSTAVMELVMDYGNEVGLTFLFGLVVLWGYVLVTVFYCECKKRHLIIKEIVGIV